VGEQPVQQRVAEPGRACAARRHHTNIITVANESGAGVPLTVDANTEFFFRTPANASTDATPIGTAPGSSPATI